MAALLFPPSCRRHATAAIAGARLYLFAGHDGKQEIDDMWALQLNA